MRGEWRLRAVVVCLGLDRLSCDGYLQRWTSIDLRLF